MCEPVVREVSPGLGFLHLPAIGEHKTLGSSRGAPRGEPSASASACCDRCSLRSECRAWLFRAADGKCFLGNCTAGGPACLERLGRRGFVGGVGGGDAAILLCTHPSGPQAPGRGRRLVGQAGRGRGRGRARALAGGSDALAASTDGAGGKRFALLLLGHRNRLMFETVPAAVIAPTVERGFSVDVFGYLENSTMAKAREGREGCVCGGGGGGGGGGVRECGNWMRSAWSPRVARSHPAHVPIPPPTLPTATRAAPHTPRPCPGRHSADESPSATPCSPS